MTVNLQIVEWKARNCQLKQLLAAFFFVLNVNAMELCFCPTNFPPVTQTLIWHN
jgi:hypothetical protein